MSPPSLLEDDTPPEPNPKVQRALIFVVVLLGLLIIAGLVAVVGRVLYLSSRPAGQPGAATGEITAPPRAEGGVAEVPVALPVGASMKSVALSGDRIAVHYDGPEGAGVIIVDLARKEIVARVPVGRDYLRH